MKILEHQINVMEGVLDKMLCRIVTVDAIQFDFMPEKGTIDSVIILRRLQEEYYAPKKNCLSVLCN